MSGYSEDLRRRIVSSVEGGMSKAQAARTFSVSLSSVPSDTGTKPAGRIPGSEEEPRIRSEAGRQSHQALGGGPRRAPLCHYPPRSLAARGALPRDDRRAATAR